MISILSNNSSNKNKQTPMQIKAWAILFWLAIWQLASLFFGESILFVSPSTVLKRLSELMFLSLFWQSILFSLSRIATGFFLGIVIGSLFAIIAFCYKRVLELLAPLILLAKTIPVASFIILVLIWIPSKNLSIFISFLMVFPIIYTNVLNGIYAINKELLEMAEIFSLSPWKKIRYIYLSQVLPFFQNGCSLSLGLCWKSGIASEIIGIPKNSIGEKLYHAKIYINTTDLFAWTFVIILISIGFEKIFLLLLRKLVTYLETT